MFKSFRWRIALWFVGLSSANYLALCLVGALYFYTSLSNSMDEELRVVASQIGHAIDLSGSNPTFRDWLRVVETEPARSIMSMQLFDSSGAMLEHYGPLGIPRLVLDTREMVDGVHHMRIRHSKLFHKGKIVGYIQLQIPVDRRDAVTREFLLTMLVMAPFVLSGFGLCSYIVSGIATRPIERLVLTLQQFVANAGHELNTPASIVQARAQSLERKLQKHGLAFEDLQIIVSSGERMGRIVKNLMLLAELDSSEQRSTSSPISWKEATDSLVKEFAPRFSEKQIRLEVDAVDPALLLCNRESLDSILRNLLENALRYTDSGGVTLSCDLRGADIIVSVQDTGIGIPPESLPYVFDRFYRVDQSRSRASGGTGLGLSIVKALCENLGGSVEVESVVGKGSLFKVRLPVLKLAPVARKLHTSSF